MLVNLKIKNFRMFESLEIERLGQVNLIVGKNNSGKSSVLEALRILARRGNAGLLNEIATGHDETSLTRPRDDEGVTAPDAELPYQHFFPNRIFPASDGKPIRIGNLSDDHFVSIEHVYFVEELEVVDRDGEEVRRARRKIIPRKDLFGGNGISTSQGLAITTREGNEAFVDISDTGQYRLRSRYTAGSEKEIPVSFVPTRFVPANYLASLWDSIALTENEEIIKNALAIIEPSIERLAFVKAEMQSASIRARESERMAIVKLKKLLRPIPLNSMGDGMYRLMQLILCMFPAKNGIVLVDEFENGLHYSVQELVWRLIFDTAAKLNAQVFATTHSLDCITAFRNVALNYQNKGVVFKISRSELAADNGKTISTVLDDHELDQLIQAGIEIR